MFSPPCGAPDSGGKISFPSTNTVIDNLTSGLGSLGPRWSRGDGSVRCEICGEVEFDGFCEHSVENPTYNSLETCN